MIYYDLSGMYIYVVFAKRKKRVLLRAFGKSPFTPFTNQGKIAAQFPNTDEDA